MQSILGSVVRSSFAAAFAITIMSCSALAAPISALECWIQLAIPGERHEDKTPQQVNLSTTLYLDTGVYKSKDRTGKRTSLVFERQEITPIQITYRRVAEDDFASSLHTLSFKKANNGWEIFHTVFMHPKASTETFLFSTLFGQCSGE